MKDTWIDSFEAWCQNEDSDHVSVTPIESGVRCELTNELLIRDNVYEVIEFDSNGIRGSLERINDDPINFELENIEDVQTKYENGSYGFYVYSKNGDEIEIKGPQ